MYRVGLACLFSAAVISGAVHCSSSEPGPGPAPAEANLRAAAQESTAPSCANCLDIHLSDYNLFLLEDYSEGHSLAGKVAAGGNITLDGFGVGSALLDDNVSNTLVAGGNLHITNGNVFGATWYGGSYTPTPNWTVNFHRGTAAQGTPIDFAARFAELRSLSSRLATQLPSNGTTEPSWGNLYMTGTDPCLNVFEVNASDFQNAQGRNIEAPAGSFVVVNIRGTTLTFSRGISFSGGITPQRVLYNFVDATRIDASSFGLPGTVLAPYARLALNDGSWSGGIYAVSLRGNATGLLSPLEDMAGAEAEVCNGVDRANGASCSSANECSSGQCVDGVCCNTACEGECAACNLAGHVGTCSMVPSTVQCRASGGECDVAEYCTGSAAACPADGFASSGAACTNDGNACTQDVCNGAGTCTHPLAPAGTACGVGLACNAAGQCQQQSASSCSGSGLIYVIPDECNDDGGVNGVADRVEVYCFNGIARFCLSGEACPWRSSFPPSDDGRTCSRAGLTSDYMANAWCSQWNGYSNYYCSGAGSTYFQ